MLTGAWLGAILMVALAAPAAFRSVDEVMSSPPPATAKMIKDLGPTAVREVLHYQVGEANRLMFETWGIVQMVLAGLIFLLLLFFSTVGRPALGLSLGMLLLALLMQFVMIPRIVESGRDMRASLSARPAAVMERFRMLHLGFTTFEMAVVLLGAILLILLLRNRRVGGTARRSGDIRLSDDFRHSI